MAVFITGIIQAMRGLYTYGKFGLRPRRAQEAATSPLMSDPYA